VNTTVAQLQPIEVPSQIDVKMPEMILIAESGDSQADQWSDTSGDEPRVDTVEHDA
jgi:hypothetical protein